MGTNASQECGDPPSVTGPADGPIAESFRGQSEPLAAVIAVSLVCLAVSAYVVLMNDTMETSETDRLVGEPTADAVWQEISDDGMFDVGTPIRDRVDPEALPEGYNVAVTVSYVDGNGKRTQVGKESFDASGNSVSLSAPDDAEQVTRAVTVRVGPGDKRPGQFTVEVWQ